MDNAQIQAKLDSMKKTRKTLSTVTLIVALVSIAVLLAYNFMPVTYLQSIPGSDFEQGFEFPGWQMIYYGFGRQFIPIDHLFDPNPITIVGMIGTLIVLIALTATYNKGRNQAKAIKEFIMAAFLIYSAIVLGVCIIPVAMTAATSGSVYNFLNQYLLAPDTIFEPMAFAWVTFVVLLAAIVKVGNGVFLLYQKNFAAKYAPKK